MAILFTEGFDAYGTSPTAANLDTYVSRKWPTFSDPGPGFSLNTGRFGGRAMVTNQNRWIQTPNFGNQTDMLAGFAINPANMTDANQYMCQFYEGTNQGMNVRLTSSGELAVYKGTTLLTTTTGAGISLSNWHTIEFFVHTHASTGTYDLHLDGVSVLSDSGLDTRASSNAYYNFVRLGAQGATSAHVWFDDVYVADDSTFLDSFKVLTVFPNGDASPNDGTPSTGTDNYAVVDEAEPNGDTDYIENAVADVEMFDYESVVASIVYAVTVNTVCRQDDATPLSIVLKAHSGATTDDGATQSVGSITFQHRWEIWEDNPDTAAPWTASEINAAQFGYEVA